jgi:5-formyltetrahydrofolate cyclo-ligase
MPAKQELRKTMKKWLAALPPEQFTVEGGQAAERLANTGAWQRFRKVLLYCSMPGEIAMRPLIDLAFRDGKETYFPKTEGESQRFFRIDSADGPWTVGAFGITEPADCGGDRLVRAGADDPEPVLVITPGLAFDREGRRMGRGRGYYDKFFAFLDGASYYSVGFCLTSQVIAEVPADNWDKKLDALCTAGGFWVFS